MGIDYGAKRIGIAISDAGGRLAFPHAIFENDQRGDVLRLLAALCKRESVAALVVGESKNSAGGHNSVHTDAKRFIALLSDLTELPVHFQWEGYTTAEARSTRRPEGAARGDIARKTKQPRDRLDAHAAQIILQSFLDSISKS